MIESGIYFGMSDDEYHADDALGSSSVKRLLINPVGWWAESASGKRVLTDLGIAKDEPEEESAAKSFGTALHVMVLEPHLFDQRYVEHEEPPEEYLTTKNSIRAALERVPGAYVPLASAQRPEYVMAARRAGLALIDDWKVDQLIRAEGRNVLSRRWTASLRLIDRLLSMSRADLDGQSMRELLLSDGYSEVSVFWIDEETGARCKARFDYLRTRGIIDLKSYGCPSDAPPLTFFLRQIERYGYELQASHYRHAWEAMGALISAGKVFGPVDTGWLKRLRADQPPAWDWLAVQSMGMPEIDRISLAAGLVEGAADQQRRQALATYRQYVDRFGLDQPWVSTRGRIVADDATFEAMRLASRMMERGEERWREA